MDNLKLILNILKDMGCTGIKISFEDEGAHLNEMMTMRYITAVVGVELSVKIGGCEAKRDIKECIHLQSDTIVAPMIESSFALKKYVNSIVSCKYTGKKSFNLETIAGYHQFDDYLPLLHNFNSITIGRVDFASSMNETRDFTNSDSMYIYVHDVFVKSKQCGLSCNLGGAISIESKEFIEDLIFDNVLDYFETRYVIFKVYKIDMTDFEKMLYYANLFEIEWMKYIQSRYMNDANKDDKRIEMIQERLDNNIVL
jgi:hypothetical protein